MQTEINRPRDKDKDRERHRAIEGERDTDRLREPAFIDLSSQL